MGCTCVPGDAPGPGARVPIPWDPGGALDHPALLQVSRLLMTRVDAQRVRQKFVLHKHLQGHAALQDVGLLPDQRALDDPGLHPRKGHQKDWTKVESDDEGISFRNTSEICRSVHFAFLLLLLMESYENLRDLLT